MRRDPISLAAQEFDLVVVGGGIFGICAAQDAAQRGLSVALLERGDFAEAASGNCFKMVHGGIRYLQHVDLARLRQSCGERTTLLRIAPHLVQPLPILIPTYGHGLRGKEILAAGARCYDLLTLDRNRRLLDPARRIPASRLVGRREALELFPALEAPGLTGGVLFHDAQMHSPARLALAFLGSALAAGAQAANHVEGMRFLERSGRIHGVEARDVLTGREFEVRGRVILNATGGWAAGLLARSGGCPLAPPASFSRDACLVLRRGAPAKVGLAVPGSTHDPDAWISRAARHLFVVPWRGCTLAGVWHRVQDGDPDESRVTEAEIREFLAELDGALPALGFEREDVALVQWGPTLFGENAPAARHLRYGKRSRLVDHARAGGLEGLITLLGVRYTTGRAEAARAVELAFRKLGRRAPPCRTGETPLPGAGFASFDELLRGALDGRPATLGSDTVECLVRNHGADHREVLGLLTREPSLARRLGDSPVIEAEVAHAVRSEMAVRLADVVFRRTDLGSAGHPGLPALERAADLMAAELGWEPSRRRAELERVQAAFPVAA